MQNVDKKDLPKLYAIAGLCVLLFGYILYTAFVPQEPPATASSAKPTPAPTAAPSAEDGVKVAVNEALRGAGLPFDPHLIGPPVGGRNPFNSGATPTPTPTPAPKFVPPPEPPTGGMDKLLGGLPQKPAARDALRTMTQIVQETKPVEMPQAPLPDLSVTGVVQGEAGENSVAILRGGKTGKDEDRRYVTIGDPVGNGYKVAVIHADGVEVEDAAGRRGILRLGSTGDNSRAN